MNKYTAKIRVGASSDRRYLFTATNQPFTQAHLSMIDEITEVAIVRGGESRKMKFSAGRMGSHLCLVRRKTFWEWLTQAYVPQFMLRVNVYTSEVTTAYATNSCRGYVLAITYTLKAEEPKDEDSSS